MRNKLWEPFFENVLNNQQEFGDINDENFAKLYRINKINLDEKSYKKLLEDSKLKNIDLIETKSQVKNNIDYTTSVMKSTQSKLENLIIKRKEVFDRIIKRVQNDDQFELMDYMRNLEKQLQIEIQIEWSEFYALESNYWFERSQSLYDEKNYFCSKLYLSKAFSVVEKDDPSNIGNRIQADIRRLQRKLNGHKASQLIWQMPITTLENSRSEVSFSPDGRHIAYKNEGRLQIYNLQTVEDITVSEQENIKDIHYSPNGKFIAASAANNDVLLWDLNDSSSPRRLNMRVNLSL